MTQPKEQQEPSMEEILSSIRRIIADEEAPDRGDAEFGAAEAQAEASSEDADATESETDTDDVLELTRVVRESGEVVELNLAAAQRVERVEEAEPEGVDAEVLEPGEQMLARADEAVEASVDAAPGDPSGQSGDHTQPPFISSMQDKSMEKHGAAMQMNEKGTDSLVSDQAAGMATGAFAKLSQAVQRTPPEVAIADDSGRSVEQFVEDMIRPMLREWLDQNMPPLVERIVQKEIQKIVRRAEID